MKAIHHIDGDPHNNSTNNLRWYETRPALAPEQWETWERESVLQHFSDEQRWGIAAMALRNQPFGFTREDVGALRTAAGIVEDEATENPERLASTIRSLADRIEALLPPE